MRSSSGSGPDSAKGLAALKQRAGRVIVAEDRKTGSVPLSVYIHYLGTYGGLLVVIALTLLGGTIGTVGTDFWLSHWSANATDLARGVSYYAGIYAAISGATALLNLLQALAWAHGAVRASIVLHERMLKRVVRCSIQFFDSTPVGRIINRFSGDFSSVDAKLPNMFASFSGYVFRVAATLVSQAVILPYTMIASAVIMVIFITLQQYYRPVSRELRRLNSVTTSPVYAHLAETMNGLQTVKSYGRQEGFIARAAERMDVNTRVQMFMSFSNRWVGIRFDGLGSLLVSVVCIICVFSSGLGAGTAGLAMSFALSITTVLNMLVRDGTETETLLSCVERIQHYTTLPNEAQAIVADSRPPPEWPAQGVIEFKDLSVRYREDLPFALKGLSFKVQGRVGICGRTGGGKSTTTLALFRMLEAAEGCIMIDGIDISKIGLHDLRSRLAIIPQDPIMFKGTLRFNLDPTSSYTDGEILAALDAVSMGAFIRAQPDGLNMDVKENGSSFSTGQRQLLCMARALLRKARVIVCDESTASVDVASDAIIQERLRALTGVTQIIVAHRLETIVDCQTVIVFDHGRVIECGSPSELLSNPDGAFSRLLKQSREHHLNM